MRPWPSRRAMADYGEKLKKQYGIDFHLRIGLNSGPVVVGKIGDDLRMDYTAIGDTTNLASRMQSLASTRHHPGLLPHPPPGPGLLPVPILGSGGGQGQGGAPGGLSAPPAEPRSRPASRPAVARGLTRFVGRTKELQTLHGGLREGPIRLRSGGGHRGRGRGGQIPSPPGIPPGPPPESSLYLEGRCLHYGGSMVYLPFLDILRSYFEIKEGDREVADQEEALREDLLPRSSPPKHPSSPPGSPLPQGGG